MSTPTDAPTTESPPDDFSLTASGNLRRRAAISRLVEAGATASALAAVAVLGVVVFGVVKRGISSISFAFLTKNPPQFGGPGGGIASAIIGTVPYRRAGGVDSGARRCADGVVPDRVRRAPIALRLGRSRWRSNLMQGLPTVIVGLFVFGLLVEGHGNSGFAGAIALSIVMLPLIARSSQEVLLLVPDNLREAADALGVSRWRTVVGVILPAALSGIVTGSILAIARAAGETAPLLFVDSLYTPGVQLNLFGHAVPNIPVMIFTALRRRRPVGSGARMGRRTRPAGRDPGGEHRRAGAAGPQSIPIDAMTSADPNPPGDRIDAPAAAPGADPDPRRARMERPALRRDDAASRVSGREPVFDIKDMSVSYGAKRALAWTTLKIYRNLATAVIGPSGCGKSTFIRSLNRMNDSIPGFKLSGQILYHGQDVYGSAANRVEVRRRIGMVFQKPNPFPKSIFDNVAWAPRNLGMKADLDGSR